MADYTIKNLRECEDMAPKFGLAPDMQARFLELGIEPVGNSPDEFASLIARETERMAGVLERAGLRAR